MSGLWHVQSLRCLAKQCCCPMQDRGELLHWGEACGSLVSSLLSRGFLGGTILLSAGACRHPGGHHR